MALRTKSPLKRQPGRMPGQSLDEYMYKLKEKLGSEYLAVFVMLMAMSVNDWIRWYMDLPINPVVPTILAVAALVWLIFAFVRTKSKLERLKLGRDGERAVGQFLERARILGYDVFHDVLCSDANIDHLIVGPGGVFTVETKTYRKPASGRALITYRAGALLKGSFDISGCLVQARAQADEMRALFSDFLPEPVKVQPVVVFPGWFVDSESGSQRDVWVLEPKAFMKWLEKAPPQLDPTAVGAARQIIARHVYERSGIDL